MPDAVGAFAARLTGRLLIVKVHTMKPLLTVVFLGIAMGCSLASHWASLGPDVAVYEFKERKCKISLTTQNKGELASITIDLEGKQIEVPKSELEMIGTDVGVSQAVVSVPAAASDQVAKGMGLFYLTIPYGPITVHSLGDKEVHSCNVVRFEFQNGKCVKRIRCVSQGDDKKRWTLFSKESGEKEVAGGEDTGIRNPLRNECRLE